jgi:low affinity Fe/Cu permease
MGGRVRVGNVGRDLRHGVRDQHTQSREQAATQRKLDELLRALPGAESGLIMLEEASEETMNEVEEGQRSLKRSQG